MHIYNILNINNKEIYLKNILSKLFDLMLNKYFNIQYFNGWYVIYMYIIWVIFVAWLLIRPSSLWLCVRRVGWKILAENFLWKRVTVRCHTTLPRMLCTRRPLLWHLPLNLSVSLMINVLLILRNYRLFLTAVNMVIIPAFC